MKKIAFLILTLTLYFPAHVSAATNYYVSPSGSDTAPGTEAQPWKTIQKCINTVTAGDTCILRGGTYPETVNISKSGTSASPITLRSYVSEKPIIDGQNSRATFTMTNASNFVFDGLTLVNSTSFGLYSVGSSNVVMKNCEVGYPLDGGLVWRNASNILVDSCNVHHTNWRGLTGEHEAVTFNNINGYEIKNSQVHDGKEEGIDSKYGTLNGKIHHNRVYGNNGPNIYIDAASNIEVYANEVSNTTGDKSNVGLAVETNSGNYSVSNISIYNNILRNGKGGVDFWVESGAESYASFNSIKIYNNLIYANSNRGGIRIGAYVNYTSNVQIIDNIFWKNSSTVDVLGTALVSYNLFDTSPKGTNAITTSDVKFINETGFDFHLANTSPAIDAGTTSSTTVDFDGNPRPNGPSYDIGPYEYISSTIPPPTVKQIILDYLKNSPASDLNHDTKVNAFDFAISSK